MKSILISIVVPVYNQSRERFDRCIDSICKQTYPLFEAVIVDDGSSEENYLMEQEICSRDKRIRLIRQENAGAGSARNNGVQNANGDYVIFLDSDDMISEFALEDAIECLGNSNVDMVVGQIHKDKEKNWKGQFFDKEKLNSIKLSTPDEFDEYINHIMGYQSNRFYYMDRYFCDGPIAKLCRRDLLLQCLFDTQKFWGEDTIWNLRFTKLCRSIVISNNVWYYAFANPDSQTHVFRPSCEYEFKCRIQQEKEIINEQWPNCKDGLNVQIWLSTYYIFTCYLFHKDNTDGFRQKYNMFLRCIREPAYKDMLRSITFKDEEVLYKRVVKKAIKVFSRYRPRIFAYMGWKAILDSKNGER